MVDIDITYEGDLHCEARHRPSSAIVMTDAPLDNHGRAQSFSPTDMVATALGCCMATVMGILARTRGYELRGMTLNVKKEMVTSPTRRIARLDVTVRVPMPHAHNIDEEGRRDLEHAASTCPVRLSLLPSIEVPLSFDWGTD